MQKEIIFVKKNLRSTCLLFSQTPATTMGHVHVAYHMKSKNKLNLKKQRHTHFIFKYFLRHNLILQIH